MGKLAELVVDIVTHDQTARGLAGVRSRLMSHASEFRRLATIPFAIGGGIAGAGATAFLVSATNAASNLNETLSKVGVVFGASSDQVTKFADEMADKFGLVRREVLDAASSFGLILQGAGMTAQASAGLSIQLAKLAADASSFYNVPIDVALEKIRAGLGGEAEPLRAFGVLLSEAAVKAKAAAMGFTTLDESTKAAARAQLIVEGLNKAGGDLERTSDSLANRQRKLTGDWENLKTELGSALIPAFQDLIDVVYQLGGALDGTFGNDRTSQMKAFGAAMQGMVGQASLAVGGPGSQAEGIDPSAMLGGNNNKISRLANPFMEGLLTISTWAGLNGGSDGPDAARLREYEAARGRAYVGKTGMRNETGAITPEEIRKRFGAGFLTQSAPSPGDVPAAPAPRVPGIPIADSDFATQMQMQDFMLSEMINVGAAREKNSGRLKDARGRLADMEKDRRDRLATGGVMGDQLSAVSSLQNKVLDDLPRQQLEEQKKTVKTLESIDQKLSAGPVMAGATADLVLRGPE
jgi:hypothetical protein